VFSAYEYIHRPSLFQDAHIPHSLRRHSTALPTAFGWLNLAFRDITLARPPRRISSAFRSTRHALFPATADPVTT
jgi:hypothetical protein